MMHSLAVQRPKPVLLYAGGKHRLAPWIVSHMPTHDAYVEPFCGSCAVLFAKPQVPHELINDRSGDVVNLFRVIRDQPNGLAAAVALTPYARDEFESSYAIPPDADPVERARLFLVRVWMAHGGKLGTRAGWRMWRKGGKASDSMPLIWDALPDRIWAVVARLKQVHIEHRDFRHILPLYSRPGALLYCDPPYVRSTLGSDRHYHYDMTDDDHHDLIALLIDHQGPALLSGYRSPLYDELLGDWRRVDVQVSAYRSATRTECLWLNPVAASMARQMPLIAGVSRE